MKYEFTQDLVTGNELIDYQHRALIDAVNKLYAACAAGKARQEISSATAFLVSYTDTHFRDEERLQIQYRYPDHIMHKRAHDAFKDVVAGITRKLDEQGPTIAVIGEVNTAVAGWLINHIKKEDTKVAAHIKTTLDIF